MAAKALSDELDEAADAGANLRPAEMASLLRRASAGLRNGDGFMFDADVEKVLTELAAYYDVPKMDFVRRIVRQALETMGNLPLHDLDEDSETRGDA